MQFASTKEIDERELANHEAHYRNEKSTVSMVNADHSTKTMGGRNSSAEIKSAFGIQKASRPSMCTPSSPSRASPRATLVFNLKSSPWWKKTLYFAST